MYKQIKTTETIQTDTNTFWNPIATLQSPAGQTYHIILDDRCYILAESKRDGTEMFKLGVKYIFPHLFKLLQSLPDPEDYKAVEEYRKLHSRDSKKMIST